MKHVNFSTYEKHQARSQGGQWGHLAIAPNTEKLHQTFSGLSSF